MIQKKKSKIKRRKKKRNRNKKKRRKKKKKKKEIKKKVSFLLLNQMTKMKKENQLYQILKIQITLFLLNPIIQKMMIMKIGNMKMIPMIKMESKRKKMKKKTLLKI